VSQGYQDTTWETVWPDTSQNDEDSEDGTTGGADDGATDPVLVFSGVPGLWALDAASDTSAGPDPTDGLTVTAGGHSGVVTQSKLAEGAAWLANPSITGPRTLGATVTADPGLVVAPTEAAKSFQWERSPNGSTSWSGIATGHDYRITASDQGRYLRFAGTVGGKMRSSNVLEVPASGEMCQRPVEFDGRQYLEKSGDPGIGTTNNLMAVLIFKPSVTVRNSEHKMLCFGGGDREGFFWRRSSFSDGNFTFQLFGTTGGYGQFYVKSSDSKIVPAADAFACVIVRIEPNGGTPRLTMAGRVNGGPPAVTTGTTSVSGGVVTGSRTAIGAEGYRGDKHPAEMKLWRLAVWNGGSLPTSMHTNYASVIDKFVASADGRTLVKRAVSHQAYGAPLIDVGGGGAEEFNRGVNHGSLGNFSYSTGGFVDADV
jgi:hypothetical protein